jgi:hypothetical protein
MFNTICWWLNRARLSVLVAALRWVLAGLLRPWQRCFVYSAPPEQVAGYAGWLEVPGLGVLAFRRADGSLQWRW